MNEYDSELVSHILTSKGYVEVSSEEEADIIIYNTCAVRERAEKKVYGRLGALWRLPDRPKKKVIVMGCIAQEKGKWLLDKYDVDLVIGTNHLKDFERIEELLEKAPIVLTDMPGREDDGILFRRRESYYAYVPIQFGCSYRCTFCIVPLVRGKQVSRPFQMILKEIEYLTSQGAKEIILLGQTVNSYGKDKRWAGKTDYPLFEDLLEKISEIKGIKWLRFTSPHPRDFNLRQIELVGELDIIPKWVHLPLQSGDDEILRKMGRGYTISDYLKIIEELRKRVPDIAITTDIIVGFPGETRQQFKNTLKVVREVEFDQAFMFAYSPRPGTKAAEMEQIEGVPEEEKKERLQELIELQNEITQRKNEAMVGSVVEALLEGPSKKDPNYWEARTDKNKAVIIPAPEDKNLIGTFTKVKLEEAFVWGFKGRIYSETPAEVR